MEAPTRSPRADRLEQERRLDQIRRWIGLCRTTGEIVREGMRQWGLRRRAMFNYLQKAIGQLAAAGERQIARQHADAVQCYHAMIDWNAAHLEVTLERSTVTEYPGRDGKPVRKVTVTRQKVLPAHAMRGIIWARTRLDKIHALEKVRPPEPPIGIDVKFPVWSEDPPAEGSAPADGPPAEPVAALPAGSAAP